MLSEISLLLKVERVVMVIICLRLITKFPDDTKILTQFEGYPDTDRHQKLGFPFSN